MNKWKTKFSYWKFDKKILLLVTVSILIVTLTVAGVSLTFSIASMKEQSVELLQMQNNTVAESFKGSMDSYKEIVLGTIMDDSVQNYCRQVQKNELKTADIDAVYSKLENLNNMYESLNFAAGGVATPADAALMMQLGAEGVFVGSGIFKSGNPAKRAAAIVQAVTNYTDAKLIAELSSDLGEAMVGINEQEIELLMAERGI